ncbi:MAG: hypothetical protein RLZZ210_1740 [Pseudomonadota bacterium]|jgi:stearoyl-CoA desaturase (delta-9 desaturase)
MDILSSLISFLEGGILHLSVGKMVIVALVFTHITIAAVTIFLHRSQAHRSLDLHAIPSHFFRFWLWLTTGMVTKEWVAVHRKHHAKCETPDDPHSPQTRGIKKVLLEGAELYRTESKNMETIEKYGHGTPDDWIERNLYTRFSWQGVGLALILNVSLFGVFGLTIWALQMAWIPIWAAGVINGLGHFIGYRNFDAADASTNLVPWGIIIGGEELHNNHHTYPTSARLSNKWYEFDIGWMYIRILEICGLAKVKKIAPTVKLNKNAIKDCTQSTLQALIHHRYDAMDKYKRILMSAYNQESDKLKAQVSKIQDVKGLLLKDNSQLTTDEQKALSEIFNNSKSIQVLYEMRLELLKLWEKSHDTSEQLLQNLQEWCKKAENSNMPSLKEFVTRVQSYAI